MIQMNNTKTVIPVLASLALCFFIFGCGNVTGGGGGGGGGAATYILGISATPEGWGTVEVSPTGEIVAQGIKYARGTIVTITAESDGVHPFDHWGGDLSTFEPNPTTIEMNSNLDITASFQHINVALNVSVTPEGAGTIEPWGGTFLDYTNVLLTAEPADSDYVFKYWIIDGSNEGSATPKTITMTTTRDVTAVFGRLLSYVSPSGDDANDGSSAHPFLTIQHGLNIAVTGGTVSVEAGLYTENLVWPTTESNITLRGESSSTTTIDGNSTDSCVKIVNVAPAQTITIEGFTIKNGYANGSSGGGIRLNSDNVTLLLNDAVIYKNRAFNGNGGGLAIYMYSSNGSTAIVRDCVFSSNEVTNGRGGGIINGNDYSDNSDLQVSNCTFEYNSSSSYGGAITGYSISLNISACDIHSNTAINGGAGIMVANGGDVKNCVIFNKTVTSGLGGGIFDAYNGQVTNLINCTLVSNEAKGTSSNGKGGGIRTGGFYKTKIINCIVWGNSAESSDADVLANGSPTIRYSDISSFPDDPITDGTATTDADPLFTNFPPTEVGDMALQGGSPVKSSGTDEAVVPTTDYTGASRTPSYSMGAFEED